MTTQSLFYQFQQHFGKFVGFLKKSLLLTYQFEFQSGTSTIDAVSGLIDMLVEGITKRVPYFAKAFDYSDYT